MTQSLGLCISRVFPRSLPRRRGLGAKLGSKGRSEEPSLPVSAPPYTQTTSHPSLPSTMQRRGLGWSCPRVLSGMH